MAFSFFRFLRPRSGRTSITEVNLCQELAEASQEYQIRELSFWVCVNLIANAIGRCEVRTFRGREEVREREYYLWNVEPNVNQSSTAFWHKLVTRLCMDNEALVISTRRRDGYDALVVADSFQPPAEYPSKQQEYKGVTVGQVDYDKTFMENDVLHLRLNHLNIKPVIDNLYRSYYRLYDAAVKAQLWGKGQHWKVHVDRMAQGDEAWEAAFKKAVQESVKPFLESNGALLVEEDGYHYENMGQKDGRTNDDSRDVRALVEDIFEFTARAFQIPAVLVNGKVEAVSDANSRFLTNCIDPICDQLQEEITRKRYGYDAWARGDYVRMDSSSILHFDLFANAAGVEKLVGSGAYTINDVRRAANQEPINEDWADKHFLTLNIGDMANARSLEAQKGGSEE